MSRTGSPLLFRRRGEQPGPCHRRAIGIDQASHGGGAWQRQCVTRFGTAVPTDISTSLLPSAVEAAIRSHTPPCP